MSGPTQIGTHPDYDDSFLAAVDLEKAEAVLQMIMDGGELAESMRTVLLVVRDHVDAALAKLKASPRH